MNKNIIGSLLVSMAATAALAADAPTTKTATPTSDVKVEHMCQNNSCKGKADCMGYGNNSCKGKNTCKGMGYLKASDKAGCEKAHGKWADKKS